MGAFVEKRLLVPWVNEVERKVHHLNSTKFEDYAMGTLIIHSVGPVNEQYFFSDLVQRILRR